MAEAEREAILAEDRQLAREIARLQQLVREIPSLIIMPKADEALQRIRQKAAELSIPAAAAPPVLARIAPGTVVRTPTGERAFVISGGTVEQSPAREVRLVLTEKGETKVVPVEELTEETVSPVTPPPQSSPSPQSPPEATTIQKSGGTATTLRPGDKVTTPLGEGVILSITGGAEPTFQVDVAGKSTFYFGASDVKPAPTAQP